MKHHPYNLKGSTLEVFSALYCLTRKRAFLGTYMDLASWIEIDRVTLTRALKKLQEKELVSIEKTDDGFNRYEFQARTIKGYPLPDYKYCGKKSTTNYPVIDAQNLDEYRKEIEATGGVIDPTRVQNEQSRVQNEQTRVQNEQELKEKKQKKNNYNIYNKDKNSNNFYLGKAVLSKNKDGVFKDEIYPPTWEMVKDYAEKHVPTISLEVAKLWLAYAASSGWEMARGRKIKDWRASLYWFDQNHIDIEKEKAARKVIQAQAGVSPDVIAMEEQMREQRRKEREQADIEANTPEALAARDAFFEKFGKK